MKKESRLLKPEQCYLHIIDPQERLMAQIHGAETVVSTIKKWCAVPKLLVFRLLLILSTKKVLVPMSSRLRS